MCLEGTGFLLLAQGGVKLDCMAAMWVRDPLGGKGAWEGEVGLMRRAAKRVLKKVIGETSPSAAPATRPPLVRPASPPPPDMANIECGAQELKERLDAGESVCILDVREPHETAGGVIEGAVVIPLGQLEVRWGELSDADEVVCYCALGARSLQAAGFLRSKGLDNATSMDGGVVAWQNTGGTLVQPG